MYRVSGHHASRIRTSHRIPCGPAPFAGTARPVKYRPDEAVSYRRAGSAGFVTTNDRDSLRIHATPIAACPDSMNDGRSLPVKQRDDVDTLRPGTIDAIRVIVVVGILAGVASLVADSERASTRRSAERDNSAQNFLSPSPATARTPPARGRRHRRHRRPPGARRWLNEQHRGGRTAARRRRSINPALDPQPGRSLDPALPGTAAAVPVTDPRRPPPQRRIPSASSPSVVAGTTAVSGFPTWNRRGGGFPESASASTTAARPYSAPAMPRQPAPLIRGRHRVLRPRSPETRHRRGTTKDRKVRNRSVSSR